MNLLKIVLVFLTIGAECVFGHIKFFQRRATKNDSSTLSDAQIIDNSKNFTISFFDLHTEQPLTSAHNLRQRRGPCNCAGYNCGCCAGMRLPGLRRQYCSNFTYDPDEFQVQLTAMMDQQVLYENMFSAKNPPPLCMPVPYTPASMCIKLFDVFTPGRNLHMCMDIETKVRDEPWLILHFDCMRMGSDGIKYPIKPEEMGGEGIGQGGGLFGQGLFSGNRPTRPTQQPETDAQVDPDVFDPITEIKIKPVTNKPNKATKEPIDELDDLNSGIELTTQPLKPVNEPSDEELDTEMKMKAKPTKPSKSKQKPTKSKRKPVEKVDPDVHYPDEES